MSDELREKLDWILKSNTAVNISTPDIGKDYEEIIPQITQAFVDAGWHYIETEQPIPHSMVRVYEAPELMTGQEWEEKAITEGWRRPE